MKSKWTIIALLGMMMLIAAPAAGQPTSFLIDGWVNDSSGDPVNDPAVVITNTNTGEVFVVETNASSNYYHTITCSDNVSAGDVLSFSVDGGTATNHAVTPDEMDAGGFEENLTVEAPVEPDFIEIGDGTETEYYVPFNGNYDYGWSKIIYTKSEIGAPITITKIAFNVSKTPPYSYAVNDQRIYMGHITNASFDGDESKPNPSTMTEVYNGSITWESGWTIITLDTSFPYNNVDNLLIYYENQDGSYESDQPLWYRTLTLPDYRSVYNYADGSFPTDDGDQVRFIPNIQLHYSGVATGIAVSKNVYDPDAGEWVDTISGAIPGETYRFRIDVTATGCDLTDVVVNDTLSPSLSYAGNPSTPPSQQVGNFIQWTLSTINKDATVTIEFDATVSYRGYDCNFANATGWCNESLPHEQHSDEDTACIDSRVDLAVKQVWNEHIILNPACANLEFYRAIVNESNTIRVWVENNGPSNITAGESFDVRFDLNGVQVVYATLQGPLNAGEDEYYDIVWTPDCTGRPEWPNYPPMPDHPSTCISPGYRLNVTVDPSNTVNETDDGNNLGWRTVSICNNGYKSKNFDCDPEDPLTSFEYYDDFYGGVVYNVSGVRIAPDDPEYCFCPGETSTRVHHIDIPSGMNVVKARLYVYWYDWGNMCPSGGQPPGSLADLSASIGSSTFAPDATYNDQKGLGSSNYPKGTYAYDVTSEITGSNDYTVVIENIDPLNCTIPLGELLLVVYEDPLQDPDNNIQLWMMEGCDLLRMDSGYGVTTAESTATVTFPGTVAAGFTSAELITVVAQGKELTNNMLFNGNVIKTDAWSLSSEAGTPSTNSPDYDNGSNVFVEVVDVTDNMTLSDNTVGFQDTGTMGMQASNAILVVKKEVSLLPDLVIVNKSETLDGSVFTVTYTVENNGGGNAGASTTCIYVDDIQVATDPVGALAPDATHEGTVVIDPFDCPCGTAVTVTVCADNDDAVDESDETNNCLNNTFDCPPCPKPDLVIINKSETLDGSAFTVTYTVENVGGGNAGASTTCIYVDGIQVATDPVGALAPDATHEGTVVIDPFDCPCGTDVTVTVCADNDDAVDESDETNNCLNNTFDCPPCLKPDLVIINKSETLDGNAFTVTYTVENVGGGNAGASTTCIYVEGILVATDPVGALAPDATHEGTVVIDPFDCPCGTDVTVTVCADNDDAVDESDENNCLNNTFDCPPCPKPDLVITEKSEDWVDQVNKTYNITYTVANNGDAAAGASTTSIKIDGVEAATDAVPALSLGESHTATLGPFTMSGDDDTINVCADRDNVVDEGDETNNCLENTFAVEGEQSYGGSVYHKKNVRFVWNALGEPDDSGAVLYRNAKIAIELEETVPACKNVSVWVTQLGFYPVYFEVAVSADGSNWNTIGSETCNNMWVWTQYDFDGEFGDVRYIKITKPGSRWPPKFMGLDAVYAKN